MARRRRSESGHILDDWTVPGRLFNHEYTPIVKILCEVKEVARVDPRHAAPYKGKQERAPDIRVDKEKYMLMVILYSHRDRSQQTIHVYLRRDAAWEDSIHKLCRVLGVSGKLVLLGKSSRFSRKLKKVQNH